MYLVTIAKFYIKKYLWFASSVTLSVFVAKLLNLNIIIGLGIQILKVDNLCKEW